MNQDDIIRMAMEADYNPREGGVYKFDNFDLERFAALVAAAEREACAKLVEPDERQRVNAPWGYLGGFECLWQLEARARAIRARGNV
jgi:hypothetical protein